MFSRTLIALAAASLAGHAVAGNPRHQAHRNLHKKALDVVVDTVTQWTTVTVNEGFAASTVQANSNLAVSGSPTAHHHSHHSHSYWSSTAVAAAAPTATSSSTVSFAAASWSTSTSSTSTTSSTTTSSTTTSSTSTTANLDFLSQSIGIGHSTATATATTTPSTSAPAATSVASGRAERGLAYNSYDLLSLFLGPGTEAQWIYNWGSTPGGTTYDETLPFCAMLWGTGSESGWSTNAQAAVNNAKTAGKTPCLLSANEPDNAGQANLTPEQAVTLHQQYMNPFSGQAEIATPAITNSNAVGQGIDWLQSWVTACNGGCVYNAVACHAYGVDGQGVLDHLLAVYDAFQVPVWLTEFQIPSNFDVESELAHVLDQVDNNSTFSFVGKISYFMVDPGSLLATDTTLSAIGSLFAYDTTG